MACLPYYYTSRSLVIYICVCVSCVCMSNIGSLSEGETEEDKLSSEKVERLGWSFRPLEETLIDAIENYRKAGLLD